MLKSPCKLYLSSPCCQRTHSLSFFPFSTKRKSVLQYSVSTSTILFLDLKVQSIYVLACSFSIIYQLQFIYSWSHFVVCYKSGTHLSFLKLVSNNFPGGTQSKVSYQATAIRILCAGLSTPSAGSRQSFNLPILNPPSQPTLNITRQTTLDHSPFYISEKQYKALYQINFTIILYLIIRSVLQPINQVMPSTTLSARNWNSAVASNGTRSDENLNSVDMETGLRRASVSRNVLRRSITANYPTSPYNTAFPNASSTEVMSPPMYDDISEIPLPKSRFKVVPRAEEGQEALPSYTCSVRRECMFERKMELHNPYDKANDRKKSLSLPSY